MAIAISLSSVTATGASIALTGLPADGTLQFQLSPRADFEHCVCPIIPGIARSSPQALTGLNQDTTYYLRVRGLRADASIEAWSNTLAFRTALTTAPTTSPAEIMIEPALHVIPNPVLAWTAGNEVTGYPILNLGYDGPVAWHSQPAGDDHSILAQMAPEPVDTIALLQTNLPEAATVVIKAGTTSGVSDYRYPPVSGTVPFRASANIARKYGYHGLFRLPAAQSYPFWKLEINAAMTGNLLHAEHCIFGKGVTSKNFSTGKTEQLEDKGSLDRNRSGNPIRVYGRRLRRVSFDISMLSEEDFELKYADIDRRVGSTEPVLLVPNSKANAFLHDRILYGALIEGRQINPASPRFTKQFTCESLI